MNLEKIFKNFNKKKTIKNKNKIFNEFNNIKWKKLLDKSKKKNIRLVDEEFYEKKILIYFKKKYKFLPFSKIKDIQAKIYFSNMKNFFYKNNNIVEIGAGYGSMLFRLMLYKKINHNFFYHLDYSPNALKIAKKIKKNNNFKNLKIGLCDLYSGKAKIKIPQRSLIYTSYCLHYGKKLNDKFMKYLISLKPKFVFHFEPIFELYKNDNNVKSKYIKKYFRMNDYSINLLSIIKKYKTKKKIKIIKIKKHLISPNIFLPLSLVIWKPINEK